MGFSSYVSAFTSGIISKGDNIKIILAQPVPSAKPGHAVTNKLFTINPAVEGQAYWLDEQTVEFRPSGALESGSKYFCEFDLSSLLDVPSEYKKLEFEFVVLHQNLVVEHSGMRSRMIDGFSHQEFFGTVRTADIVNPDNLESCFSATQSGNDLDISWTHSGDRKTHHYNILEVKRSNNEGEVKFKWNGDVIGAPIRDAMTFRVPPIGEFTVLQITTEREPGLHFSIQFSDPLDSGQDLEGLVRLKSEKNIRVTASNNQIDVYPVETLSSQETIMVDASIESIDGGSLKNSYKKILYLNLEKPALELIGDGVIMPTDGKLNFPFKAINLKAVNLRILQVYEDNVSQFLQQNQLDDYSNLSRVGRVVYDDVVDLISTEAIDYGSWNNFQIDLNNYIDPQPGAIYSVQMAFERYQSLYPCGDTLDVVKPLQRTQFNFDKNSYYNPTSWYTGYARYNERDDPCTDSYYKYRSRHFARNVLASNLGIVAKESSGDNYNIVVTDLRTTNPLGNVKVEAFNFQHQLMISGSTNSDGFLNLETDGKPYLLVATYGKQKGYLKVDNGSELSLSVFDVGGTSVEKGVKGFIYGERGVWRPGDEMYLSFVLEDKENAIPEAHPVIMELYDPQGKLYSKKVSADGVSGMYAFDFKTKDNSPTGKWRAKAIVGNSTFTKYLKVETVKPNRLKIDLDLPKIISSANGFSTTLSADWLYGAPGAHLKNRVELSVSSMSTSFDGFEGFHFDDHSNRFYETNPIVVESQTFETGKSKLFFNWKSPESAPGMLKMRFNTKVFETGGDYSQDFTSCKFSPYKSYVGIKMPAGYNWRSAINTEEVTACAFAAVDANGNPIDKRVRVELYELRNSWWWEGNGEADLTRYINRSSAELKKTDYFTIKDGQGLYDLEFPKRDWGKHLLRIVDLESGHSSLVEFYADYPGWYNNMEGSTDAASMINIETDKEEYEVGEKATISIPSGGIGRTYITLEKGDKIIDQFWVDASGGNTKVTIPLTREMAPNFYVNAVSIQPHGQTDNSLPIRMYGVVPVKVTDPKTHLTPVIETPLEVRPESEFEITVSEEDGKEMAYTLAVVDEGLLSLTRYKTPNPWYSFYSKEALGVKSWDMYKYVMSAETGKMAALLAVGGDEDLANKEDAKANRFQSVVQYLGPFKLDANDSKSHTVKIPNYIGSVRVMVVAADDGAYGSSDEDVLVKKPLMVLSTLPRILGPSEKVSIPVNVISMSDDIKNVNVKVITNDLLVPVSGTEKTIDFESQGEKTVYFNYDVSDKLGVARFKVEVSSGNETAFEELEIQVRPSNPEIDVVESSIVMENGEWNHSYESFGLEGTNEASLLISRFPDISLNKNLNYLIRYPHGCIEQTTSAAFPQLVLGSFIQLTDEQKAKTNTNVQKAIDKLISFQQPDGGFSYWPGGDDFSEWGTNYAGHFMVEAKNAGYELPAGMYDSWVKFQKKSASEWNRNQYLSWGRYRGDLSQAYRLYTLALAGSPDVGSMNRLKNEGELSSLAAWKLASAYAVIGRKNAASELMEKVVEFTSYREMGYCYGSDVRDRAIVLETLIYMEKYDEAGKLVEEIANELSTGWHSTQTIAYSLIAIEKLLGDVTGDVFEFSYTINGSSVEVSSEHPIYTHTIEESDIDAGTISINNYGNQPLFVNYTQSGIPSENTLMSSQKGLQMTVEYVDIDGNLLTIDKLQQGQDFKAIVTVTHPGRRSDYKEIALNQIFPSGWQILNSRVSNDYTATSNVDFQDIRDDRVLSYFSLDRFESKRIEISLNATFLGEYYLPAIYCAPMYDESVSATIAGQWIEVIK